MVGRSHVYIPTQLDPVELSQQEQVELDLKLTQLGFESQDIMIDEQGWEAAVPTPYSEDLAERELSSLLADDGNLVNNIALIFNSGQSSTNNLSLVAF